VPPPPMAETPRLTVGAGASAGAQEAAKEAVSKGPSVQVGSTAGGRSRVEEMAMGGPDVIRSGAGVGLVRRAL
jgi:hypothetical protein